LLTKGHIDLGLAQILPMFDDDTGAEPKIVSASFADPFLLLVRDDASIFVAQCDDSNELEEIEREDDGLLTTKWLTGCLYTDTTNAFASVQSDKGSKDGENVMVFLLSSGGALHVSFDFFNVGVTGADVNRYMLYQTYQNQSTLQRGSVSYHLSYLPTMQPGDQPRARL
jgi:hypothetical protein